MNLLAEQSVPNTGRILDYWLGGQHHSPADMAAGRALDAIYGEFPKVFRVLRDFIGRSARFIQSQGVDQFIVFGSGIPTQGNIHEAVPGARVLYTDIDPVNVELGQRILAGVPGTGYTRCDVSDLSTLDMDTVTRVLGPIRRLGIVVVGVAVFVEDKQLRATYQKLYDLAPPGSWLAFDFDSTKLSEYPSVLQMLGDGFYMRTPETFAPLLGPWQLAGDGILPVAAWRNPGGAVDFPTFMYGGVASRP